MPRLAVMICLSLVGLDCSRAQERPRATNRLGDESSPYLLLHATNPVDWFPWGEEAITLARELDKPIFLSVGYSTCYWCHRMEEDVFSDPEIAAMMNEGFINIKVDREERPDIDEIYMTATQLMNRRGGWPNSIFLTPELKPFFAGTYFPPEDVGERIGFPTVLNRIQELWAADRARIEESAERIASAMEEMIATREVPAGEVPSPDGVRRAVETLSRAYDEEWGGFTPAPKFPSPANLYLLHSRAAAGNETARVPLVGTLQAMGRGALYDHVGGGFHRYATDREWRVPHFEKMLYDNAALAEIFIEAAELTKEPELGRWGRGTLDFVLEELTHEDGGFESAIDAQTDGREGAFYVWRREELEETLSDRELELVAPIFGFDGEPNFEEHFYTVYLTASLSEHAERLQMSREALLQKLDPILQKLREKRRERPFPLVDDKVLTDWNGMMIAALAKGGRFFGERRYTEAAERAASFLLSEMRSPGGTLQHSWRAGEAKIDAFLDDYAFFIKGLVTLHRETGEAKWLEEAARLADELEMRLRDPAGGYYQTTPEPFLLLQTKGIMDGAIPSGNGVAALLLMELAEETGRSEFRERATASMRAFATVFERYPSATKMLGMAIARYHEEEGTPLRAGAERVPRSSPMSELARSVVTARLETSPGAEAFGRRFELRLEMREGWHVNANPASSPYFIPTEVKGGVRDVVYPAGEMVELAFSDEAISVYSGSVSVTGELSAEASSITLVYQACDDERCLSPVEKIVEVP